jgi:hypothetical protein
VRIRKAIISDARGIAEVHVDTWLSTYRGIMPDERLDRLNYDECEKKWLRNIQNSLEGKEILLVAEINNKIVGFCGGSPNDDPDTKENYASDLRVIYIFKDYQN